MNVLQPWCMYNILIEWNSTWIPLNFDFEKIWNLSEIPYFILLLLLALSCWPLFYIWKRSECHWHKRPNTYRNPFDTCNLTIVSWTSFLLVRYPRCHSSSFRFVSIHKLAAVILLLFLLCYPAMKVASYTGWVILIFNLNYLVGKAR